MSGDFEKNSLDWQLHLWQLRIAEWLDRLFQPSDDRDARLPNWSFPEWLLRSLFWAIAIALILWALWQLYTILRPYIGMYVLGRKGQQTPSQPAAKPVAVSEWMQRSRSFAQQGNYREACRALYQAGLQKLDDTKLIPNQLSRTDGEYLNCLQALPNPRPYQVLIRTHERLCFSHADITAETYNHCEQAYREIETP